VDRCRESNSAQSGGIPRDLRQLSAVDATSFMRMSHARIRTAFAFDHHFNVAGCRLAA
jgi:predicted nucleic acid-binding protein